MADKTFLVHVGFPKTGTTTLQGTLFRRLPDIQYLGKFSKAKLDRPPDPPWLARFRRLINAGDVGHVIQAAPGLRMGIQQTVRDSPHAVTVLSLEGFSNPYADHDLLQTKDVLRKASDLAAVLTPLREAGILPQIMLTLRPQAELLPSLFAQVYLQGFISGLWGRSYDAFLDHLLTDDLAGHGHGFCFDKVVAHYQGLFGAQAVIPMAMKQVLAADDSPGVLRLAALLGQTPDAMRSTMDGARVNVRKGPKGARNMVIRSKAADHYAGITGRNPRGLAFGPGDRLRIWRGQPVLWQFDPQRARITKHYAASNLALRDQTGIDLTEAG